MWRGPLGRDLIVVENLGSEHPSNAPIHVGAHVICLTEQGLVLLGFRAFFEPHRQNPKQHLTGSDSLWLRLFIREHLNDAVKDSVVYVLHEVLLPRSLAHKHVEDLCPGVFEVIVVDRALLLEDLHDAGEENLEVRLADELA